MRALRERIDWILHSQGISARELARRSGLVGAHVSILLKRLEEDDEAIMLKTARALAHGAGVSLAWLATGAGAPSRGADILPSRSAAAELARGEGVWPEAIRSVLADELAEADADRSPDWWLLRMKLREVEMIEEAKRRDVERAGRARERTTSPPVTAPAKSTKRRKGTKDDAGGGAEKPETKPPRR